MINFFRKIRQKLLAESNFRKYLIYAAGEIILVVVGILIALQINTWNENRKASNEEIKILSALRSDFKVSKERIEETIKSQSRVMKFSQLLINIYERQNTNEIQYFDVHLDSLDRLLTYGTSWYRAEPVTGAYNSLISAGKIDLIRNEDLRHLLAQFNADFESGFEDHETAMHLLNNLNSDIDHFTLTITANEFRRRLNYEPRKIDRLKISEALFSNDSFFGNLFLKSVLERNRLKRQEQMLEQTKTILEIIDQELE